MQQFTIGPNEAGQRFDKYLKKLLKEAPNSFLYKMMRKKNIVLNGKRAEGSEKLALGDQVKLFLSDETIEKFRGNDPAGELFRKYPVIPLEIIYEDEEILVLNKPGGMLSQKAAPTDVSANEYIIGYLLNTGQLTPEQLRTFTPSVCNRLDRNTSGILIAGKSLAGLQEMSRRLKERSLAKYYQCLVWGRMEEELEQQAWLFKDEAANRVTVTEKQQPGASSIRTGFRPLAHYQTGEGVEVTLMEVHLFTGRSHQIRGQLAALGHPILGDFKYAINQKQREFYKKHNIPGQLLHAWRLEWADGQRITAPLPEHFTRVLEQWKGEGR